MDISIHTETFVEDIGDNDDVKLRIWDDDNNTVVLSIGTTYTLFFKKSEDFEKFIDVITTQYIEEKRRIINEDKGNKK